MTYRTRHILHFFLGLLGGGVLGLIWATQTEAMPPPSPISSSTSTTLLIPLGAQSVFDCVQATLSREGESFLQLDRQQGLLLSAPHAMDRQMLQDNADLPASLPPTQWRSGSYQWMITLLPITNDQTQMQIATRMLGWSEPSHPAMMRPSGVRVLISKQKLEDRLATTLKQACDCATSVAPKSS
ncbi:MAG: hypothetical protein WCD18_24330 [Thermosynechococcaceae cyanobacterium]